MNLATLVGGLPEIRGAAAADAGGRVLQAAGSEPVEQEAAAAARALAELSAAGVGAGLNRLEMAVVRGAATASVIALRGRELVLAKVDPSRGTAAVEKALAAWAADAPPAAAPPSASGAASRASKAVGEEAVFSGRLSVFGLPDVIELVRSARRTGRLVCSSGKSTAMLRFRAGRITDAESSGAPGVGELLVRAREIPVEALRGMQTSDPLDPPIGARLVGEGLVDAAAVAGALRRCVAAILRELVSWADGEFAFGREGEEEESGSPREIELDAQEVLLDVFRQLDEEARNARGPRAGGPGRRE